MRKISLFLSLNVIISGNLANLSLKIKIPSNIKLTIYNSLFRSYTEYGIGISAWGRNKCSEIKQIHIFRNEQYD